MKSLLYLKVRIAYFFKVAGEMRLFMSVFFLECTKLDFLKIQKMFFFKYFHQKLELDGKTFGLNCKCY